MLTLYEISALHMQYYALCIHSCFVMYQKVYLLLDDITVVAAEGDERCLGVHECIELSFAFQNYMHNSYLLHKNSNTGVTA